MNARHQFEPKQHERGDILLVCTGCDAERDAPVAYCPLCEERTVSYEYVVGFDYAQARMLAEVERDLAGFVPRNLVAPLLATEPMEHTAKAWREI